MHDHVKKTIHEQCEAFLADKTRLSRKDDVKLLGHEALYNRLLPLADLMRWLRDNDPKKHGLAQEAYKYQVGDVYRKEIKEMLDAVRLRFPRRLPSPEEAQYGRLYLPRPFEPL